jgi:hypothetical protein
LIWDYTGLDEPWVAADAPPWWLLRIVRLLTIDGDCGLAFEIMDERFFADGKGIAI